MSGGLSQDEVSKRVLVGGECTREVDGVAEELQRSLGLGGEQHLSELACFLRCVWSSGVLMWG